MKRSLILIMAAILLAAFSSCVNNKTDGSPAGANGEQAQTELPLVNTPDPEPVKKELFCQISFNESPEADRVMKTPDFVLGYPKLINDSPIGFAVCIVSVMGLDKSACSDGTGGNPLLEIRIDETIEKNPAFELEEGQTVTATDFSYWSVQDGIYLVSYYEGIIPITEAGAEYIVWIYKMEENNEGEASMEHDYKVSALTIPILENAELSDDEIYELLKLPEDVEQCSRELIERFIDK